eukprot:superscaffoldBa00004745_g19386
MSVVIQPLLREETDRAFCKVPRQGGKEEEWTEEERVAGQTVRGKGSKGPGCPGEGDPLLQQCPHQASGYGPGPAEVRSQCAWSSLLWKTRVNVNKSELLTRSESGGDRCHNDTSDLQGGCMHPIAVSPFKMDTGGDKPVGPPRGVSSTAAGQLCHNQGNTDSLGDT